MSLIRRSPDLDLTADEIALLKSQKVPTEIHDYLARQHENIGLRISAFAKVAAAADAEYQALLAVRRLEVARDDVSGIGEYRQRIAGLEGTIRDLRRQNLAIDAAATSRIAGSALAVHSQD